MAECEPLTTDMLIWAYSHGIFPMADSRQGQLNWYSADPRAVLPLDGLRVSRSLRKRVRRGDYIIRFDVAFEQVVRHCAYPRRYEGETWINDQIIEAYTDLHFEGFAHSVEAWRKVGEGESGGKIKNKGDHNACSSLPKGEVDTECYRQGDEELVGGLYGVSLAGAFFGESMFTLATDASKVCLVHLVEHLNKQNFALLDSQMNSEHMSQFGTIEIPRDDYLVHLKEALALDVDW